MREDFPRRKVVLAALALMLAISAYGLYGWMTIERRMPINFIIYFSVFFVLTILASALVLMFWRERAHFSYGAQAFMLFFGPIVIWYFLFAPVYYVLSLNLSLAHLKWSAFAFAWEVPVVGGVIVLTFLALMRPMIQFINGTFTPPDPAQFYRRVLRYPILVGINMFLFSNIGFAIGTLQIKSFAPMFEQVKNTLNGAVNSLFFSILLYLFLDVFLIPVRAKLERMYGVHAIHPRKISRKVMGVVCLTIVASIGLISLFVVKSYQGIVRESIVENIEKSFAKNASAFTKISSPKKLATMAKKEFQYGRRGTTYALANGEMLPSDRFFPETLMTIANTSFGVADDLKRDIKVLVWHDFPHLNMKIVSVTYAADFYGSLNAPARFFALGGLFVLILTMVIVAFISFAITRSIRMLTAQIAAAEKKEKIIHVATADEIEELSHAFQFYVHESRSLREGLEEKVAERTLSLQKAVRELKRAKAELERLNEMKSEFVSLVSHQLRTPVAELKAYTENMLAGLAGNVSKKQMEYLTEMRAITKRYYRLISDLLNLSRIERGVVTLNVQPLKLKDALDIAVREYRDLAAEKGLTLLVEPYEKNLMIRADKDKLIEAIGNVIHNAIKFTEKGGVSVRVTGDPLYAYATVTDTGIGISEEVQRKLFTKEQILSGKPAAQGGVGLGLFIVKQFMNLMSGDISAESKTGKGSMFTFKIPLFRV